MSIYFQFPLFPFRLDSLSIVFPLPPHLLSIPFPSCPFNVHSISFISPSFVLLFFHLRLGSIHVHRFLLYCLSIPVQCIICFSVAPQVSLSCPISFKLFPSGFPFHSWNLRPAKILAVLSSARISAASRNKSPAALNNAGSKKQAVKPGLAHHKLNQALAPRMQNQLACLRFSHKRC